MELPQQQHRHHRKQNNLCTEKSRAHRAKVCVLQGQGKFCFYLHRGVTALSPPVPAVPSAKGHAGRANPFPNMLRFGGFTVVKGRKVIPCMESPVPRFGTRNIPVKALGSQPDGAGDKGHQRIRHMGNPSCFPMEDSDSACKS